jgi:tetratricopeptide (TPR) repeat protein
MFNKISNLFKKPIEELSDEDCLLKLLNSEQTEDLNSEAKRYLNQQPNNSRVKKQKRTDADKSQKLIKYTAHKMGMSYFEQAKYGKALPYFLLATHYNPEVSNWFNIVTSATLSGNVELGREAFDNAIKLKEETDEECMTIPFIYYYYACSLRNAGEYNRALEQINELRKIHEELRNTDSTYLNLRGVPSLVQTIDVSLAVFNGIGKSFDAIEWLSSFSQKVDEAGQQYLNDIKSEIYC